MALSRVTIPFHDPTEGATFPIPPDRWHYLHRVLRLAVGEQFIVMNGQGCRWRARLEHNQGVLLEELTQNRELGIEVHLGVAMPKGSGMETIIKQTTELGVTRITPVISHYSLLRPSSNKLDRWRKIAQEAAELACRSLVPLIEDPLDFSAFIDQNYPHKMIGVTTTAPSLLDLLSQGDLGEGVCLLTGAEGGWTELEITTATDRGWQPMCLAPGVLAATTAPVVALAIVNAALMKTGRTQLLPISS